MINYAEQRYEATLQAISDMNVSPEWKRKYLQLRGIKGFFDEFSWDQLCEDAELNLDWVKEWRANEEFKKYYKLREQLDSLEPLVSTKHGGVIK